MDAPFITDLVDLINSLVKTSASLSINGYITIIILELRELFVTNSNTANCAKFIFNMTVDCFEIECRRVLTFGHEEHANDKNTCKERQRK